MIIFVVRRLHPYTIGEFITSERSDPTLASRIRVLSYETLFSLRALPAATYVFSDHERLSSVELEKASWIWNRLLGNGCATHLLNDPLKVRRRYDLLRTLAQAGLNSYAAYRVTEPHRPARYPVFLRGENDHKGPCTTLLHDNPMLNTAIEERLGMQFQRRRGVRRLVSLFRKGIVLEPTLIVEYCAQADDRGHFTKYAAFRVGEQIIARHRFVSKHWAVKRLSVVDPETLQLEYDYVKSNPHAEALRKVFDAAHIDYGRIDYAVIEGKIEVYEINTNPMTVGWVSPPERDRTDALFAQRFCDALRAINSREDTGFIQLDAALSADEPVSARARERTKRRLEKDHHRLLLRTLRTTLNMLRPVVPYPSRVMQIGRRQVSCLWRGTSCGLPFRLGVLVLILRRLSFEIVRSCWIRRCRRMPSSERVMGPGVPDRSI